MLNLDTHILVASLAGDLTDRERTLVANEDLTISDIVPWELAKLVELGRLVKLAAGSRANRRLDKLPINVCACFHLRTIAFCLGENLQKLIASGRQSQLLHKINRAAGVLQNLNRLDPGDVVKEPAAARVHQKQHAL